MKYMLLIYWNPAEMPAYTPEEQQANAIGNGDHGVDITAQLAFAFRIEKRTAPTQCHNGDTNDCPRQPTAHCLLHGGSLGIFNVTIAIV